MAVVGALVAAMLLTSRPTSSGAARPAPGFTISRAYGTLGKGMHARLPGHSFVLVDKTGVQRWYGEYPSMWLSPADLLTQVRQHLSA